MSQEWNNYCKETGIDPMDKVSQKMWYREKKKAAGLAAEKRVEQAHKDTCDIGLQIRKYDRRGFARLKSQVDFDEEALLDLTGFDYKESMDAIARVNSEFEQLPSRVRNEFDNDPGRYLKYLSEPGKAADKVKPPKKGQKDPKDVIDEEKAPEEA